MFRGHDTTALASDSWKVAVSDPRLHWIMGDILNGPDVAATITGQDPVICSLGTGVTFKHVTSFSDGTQHPVDTMHEHSI